MGLVEQVRLRLSKEKTEADVVERLVDPAALTPFLSFPEELEQQKEKNLAEFAKNRIPGEDEVALVIRRFQPPHAGHLYSIEAALQVAHTVVIGIARVNVIDDRNPFTADFREGVLRDELEARGLLERVRFIHLKDYNNDKLWGKKSLEQAERWGKVNVVVGNSEWVNGIFEKRGYRTLEAPDIARDQYKSTVIRAKLRASGALRPVGK